jgi:putative hydrolase
MDPPPGFPFGMDPEALRDAPLFRELQRVMASTGPVNWELARQIAIASAAEAGPDPAPDEEDHRLLDEAVRIAELQVAALTGLDAPGDVAEVRAVRRAEWISENTSSMRGLLEPTARRVAEAIERAIREQSPEGIDQMTGVLSQIGPLLQGTQVGQVLGLLAQQVLGQYDVAVPRTGPGGGALLFVAPNIASFERDWSLDPREFRVAVALHEVTHRFEFARPWAHQHFGDLVDDFLSTLTIDVSAIQQRFEGLDPSDPASLQQAFDGEEDGALFGAVLDDEQLIKLGRVQAFMAAAEGYGDHVVHAVGAKILGSYPQIAEAMTRFEAGGDTVFERLLGIQMKQEQYEQGRAFCDVVVEQTDEATLARIWASPEDLPSLPEIEEPRLWLARAV